MTFKLPDDETECTEIRNGPITAPGGETVANLDEKGSAKMEPSVTPNFLNTSTHIHQKEEQQNHLNSPSSNICTEKSAILAKEKIAILAKEKSANFVGEKSSKMSEATLSSGKHMPSDCSIPAEIGGSKTELRNIKEEKRINIKEEQKIPHKPDSRKLNAEEIQVLEKDKIVKCVSHTDKMAKTRKDETRKKPNYNSSRERYLDLLYFKEKVWHSFA